MAKNGFELASMTSESVRGRSVFHRSPILKTEKLRNFLKCTLGRFLINFLISKTNQIKIENARTQTEKKAKIEK